MAAGFLTAWQSREARGSEASDPGIPSGRASRLSHE
jgi:hypothetical protein